MCSFDERNSGRAVISKEDIQKPASTDDAHQVFVRYTIRQISDEDGALVMSWNARIGRCLEVIFFRWSINGRVGLAKAQDSLRLSLELKRVANSRVVRVWRCFKARWSFEGDGYRLGPNECISPSVRVVRHWGCPLIV